MLARCNPILAYLTICIVLSALLAGCSSQAENSGQAEQAGSAPSEHVSKPTAAIDRPARAESAEAESIESVNDDSADSPNEPMLSLPALNGPKLPLPSNSSIPRPDITRSEDTTPRAATSLAVDTLGSVPPQAAVVAPQWQLQPDNVVQVYFATDRLPTAELLPSPLRIFAPALVVGMLCVALWIGLTAAKRFQPLWLISGGLAVCLGVIVLHATIIRWQQFTRLANNATTRFSTFRYEATDNYPLHVGMAKVSLPERHQPGQLEAPSLLRLEFSEDVDKHIVLHSLTIDHSVDAWFARLAEQQADPRNETFIFLHGYNVKFGDALKRTAQLSKDLQVTGPAICYSWPSRGQLTSYTADEATVSWSSPHFEQLLTDLRERGGCQHINIVAHSMGNRALLEAIERSYLRDPNSSSKLIDTLVLAAPDVDTDQFTSRFVTPINAMAERTTIYISDSDRALQLSQSIHQAPRLGIATEEDLPRLAGIETVHIGQQPLFGIGHSYYGSDVAVIDDMRALLLEGKPAADRLFLRTARTLHGTDYWRLDRTLHAKAQQSALR
ncbi:MAG: alpha/beta hydrolase [Pirellulaceae bacterium]